tara:strand:+ start:214 stop:3432 length:3219 start_codon:yes stop_codon:yes gene_type:complete
MTLIIDTKNTITSIQKKILPKCEELFFQIGYFYFSGFEEIYKYLKTKKIKIIIGMSYDEKISELVTSSTGIKERYFNRLIQDINDTEILDQKIHQDSHNLFVEKIKDGSLEIRCDPERNDHSKFFIFKYLKNNITKTSPGTVLAGSSNFTKSGFLSNLQKNNNYLFDDAVNYNAHLDRFNKSWSQAIPIVNKQNFDEFETKVIKKTWINKTPNPYLLFLKVLDEYFQTKNDNKILMPKELSSGEFFNVKYQEDAIIKGLQIIQKHQGVIIADVVGLGKSIVASAIAKNLDLNTIVVCPPHLVDQWEEYMNIAGVPAKVISRGKIKDTFKFERPNGQNTIILDEAHYYRNDLTIDYTDLHMLCTKNKVILLSATPFNNKPQDIFNMIKLFQIPTKTSLQTIENLSEEFKYLIKEYNAITKLDYDSPSSIKKIKEKKDKIANQMRTMLSPIVIRRSRLDLKSIDRYKKDLDRQKITFPKVSDPILIEYDLGSYTDLYIETLNIIAPKSSIKEYTGARYKPTTYIKPKYIPKIAERAGVERELLKKTQENMDDFIKRLLVRRFESCIASFLKTLDAIINSNIQIKKYYDNYKIVPIYKKGNLPDAENIISGDDDNIDIENFENIPEFKKLKEKGFWHIKKEELKNEYYSDLLNDIALLKRLKADWSSLLKKDFVDPKFNKFEERLRMEINRKDHRKILVFSEFADTAEYLNKKLLEKKFNVFKYTSKEGSKKENRKIIKNEFDAKAAELKNNFNVLVATDAIAEGYNLNRAGTIINYDIPYNPTKVIQRVGRINRINKQVYEELFIYNFFPTGIGEKEVRTKKITSLKMSMFKALFGDDTRVLTKEEDLESFFKDQYKSLLEEGVNPETYFENIIYNIRELEPDVLKEAQDLPRRIRVNRRIKCNHGSGVLIYAKKGDESMFRFLENKNKFKPLPPDQYLEIFEASKTEKSNVVSEEFEKKYTLTVQGLFKKNYMAVLDKGKRDSIQKLEAIMQLKNIKFIAYLRDLLMVIKELDALPPRFLKQIRAISKSNLDRDLKKLINDVTPDYLDKIISKAKNIDKEEEKLIISEEIINA